MPEGGARGARLPAPVKGLSAVSLFNDLASEMVYPLLPAFITRNLGGTALALGTLDGAADLTASLLRWVSGRLSDRPGWTKPLILAGYGIANLVRPLIAAAGAAWQVIGFRVLDRMGKGLRSPARDAVITTLTPTGLRGRAFGFNRAADHLGAVLGSVVAWAMLEATVGVRDVIVWSAAPGVLAILVLLVALRGIRGRRRTVDRQPSTVDRNRDPGEDGPVDHAPLTGDAVGRAYWVPVAVLVLLTVARLPETLLLLRLQELEVPIAVIPLAWAGLHLVRSGSAYPGGWLVDRAGVRLSYLVASAAYVGVAVLLAGAVPEAVAVGGFVLLGLVAGFGEPAERVAIGWLAPVRTGRGFGTYQAVAGIAALPAGIGFGALYRSAGGPAALLLSAAVLAVATLLWIGFGPRVREAAVR
ncbi:MAG: MFS transporter [Gemmatimonadales bacterium]